MPAAASPDEVAHGNARMPRPAMAHRGSGASGGGEALRSFNLGCPLSSIVDKRCRRVCSESTRYKVCSGADTTV